MKRRGGRRREQQAVTQCERCMEIFCRRQEECARLECEAIARGARYWCEDYEPPWHERVAQG